MEHNRRIGKSAREFAIVRGDDQNARPPPRKYKFDESQFVVLDHAAIASELDPVTFDAPNGVHIGMASFMSVREKNIGVDLTEDGNLVFTLHEVTYTDLPRRIRNLKAAGVRPSQSERALQELDDQLAEWKSANGLSTSVLTFPERAPS